MADSTTTKAPQAAPAGGDAAMKLIAVEQVRGAIKYRNKDERLKRWKKYDRIAAHNYVGGEGKDAPKVNLMAARTRAIAPQLAFGRPTFAVTAKGELPDPNSEVAIAAMLERTWVEEEFHLPVRDALYDWPSKGIGGVFVGFEAAGEGNTLDAKKAILDASAHIERQNKAHALVVKARDMLGLSDKNKPVDPPSPVTTLKFMSENRVFIERISPYDLALDPCATSIHDCEFMARRLHLPLVKAQLMFGATCPDATSIGNVAVYTDTAVTDPFAATEAAGADAFPDEVKRVEVWQHWSMSGRTTTYLDRVGKVILGPQPWASPFPGFPIVLLEWDKVADCVWPEGLMAAMHDLNDELNEVRRREIGEMGKAFGIIAVPETLSTEKETAIVEAKDRVVLRLSEDEIDRIKAIQLTAMPPELWGLENRIKGDLDEISRTSSSITGSMPSGDHTATEASFAQGATDAAMADRQQQVENFVAQIAERVMAILFATFDQPVTVHIPNQDPYLPDPGIAPDPVTGEPSYIPVGTLVDYDFIGTEHAGFYTVDVMSGSMASSAKDVERQQMAQIAQLYGPQDWFDLKAFAMAHMATFSSIKDPSRFIVHQQQQTSGMGAESNAASQPPAPASQPPAPQQLPPDMTGGMLPPTNGNLPMRPDLGIGSGQPQADLLAATMGGGAPGTGVNGATGY